MDTLASPRARMVRPVAARLLDPEEAPRFDFLQAVRLLEVVRRRARAQTEAVRFRALAHAAPAAAWGKAPHDPAAERLALAGVLGAPPRPLAELLAARAAVPLVAEGAAAGVVLKRLLRTLAAARRRRRPAPGAAVRADVSRAARLLEAVRRLERARDQAVRFRSKVSMAFPASDVAAVRRPREGGAPFEMTVNFLGLAGVTGPLPRPLTELVLARVRREPRPDQGDVARGARPRRRDSGQPGRDFLDLFNHRLVRLMFAARRRYRPALSTTVAEDTPLAQALFALVGLGTRGTRGRLRDAGVQDGALLTYAGLLAQRPRSMAGLESLLCDYFGVPVRGVQFRGRWHALEAEDRTRVGARLGRNHALGVDAVLGGRVWDQQAAFEIEVGPLTAGRFQDFLPSGTAFRPLCELVRFWVGVDLEFTVRLRLGADQAPAARLSGAGWPRLGWSSWLHASAAPGAERQVVLGEGSRVPAPPAVAWRPGARREKLPAPRFFPPRPRPAPGPEGESRSAQA